MKTFIEKLRGFDRKVTGKKFSLNDMLNIILIENFMEKIKKLFQNFVSGNFWWNLRKIHGTFLACNNVNYLSLLFARVAS